MGPAPETSTSSPSTGKRRAVCTALPKGSKMAATSSSMPSQWCHTLVMGSDHVLGEGTIASDAQADGVRTEVAAPGQAMTAAAADDVALAADDLAGVEVADVGADLDDLADELVAHDERRFDGRRRPGVP